MYYIMCLGSPRKPVLRPISASRKTQEPSVDDEAEAEAVMAAMRAENEWLEYQRRDARSAPGRSQVI